MADPALTIYGVQWQERDEPWGWETSIHLTDEDEARRVYAEALDEARAIYEGPNLDRFLAGIRLARIRVYAQAPPSESNPSGDAVGVEEIARGG